MHVAGGRVLLSIALVTACAPHPTEPASTANATTSPTTTTQANAATDARSADSCESCTEAGHVWCTKPRGCVTPGTECKGLQLRDEPACVNDSASASVSKMHPQGAPITGRLEDFHGVTFRVEPNRCYRVSYTLGPQAKLVGAPATPMFRLRTAAETTDQFGPPATSAKSLQQCAYAAGTLRFRFVYVDRYVTAASSIGTGDISVQLYSGPAPPQKHAAPAPPSTPQPNPTRPPPRRSSGGGCLTSCFLNKNDCRQRCNHGGSSGSSFRRWCADECDRRETDCKQGCIDRAGY